MRILILFLFTALLFWAYQPTYAQSKQTEHTLSVDNALNFYELLVIQPEGESLVYKVKHFNPDLSGWEEKEESVRFPLVRLSQETAFFAGLTIIRNGDQLTHCLSFKDKYGQTQKARLTYSRRG